VMFNPPSIDPTWWAWLEIGSEWLTAIGTIGAVIVSLYLSRRDRHPRLTISGAIVRSFAGDPGKQLQYSEGTPFVRLTATNTGYMAITVAAPCWRIGILRRRILFQNPPATARFTEELTNHGQQRVVDFPATEMFSNGWQFMREEIRKYRFPHLAIWSLKCGFNTSTGQKFFGPLNWELKKMISDNFCSNPPQK
jgi:hypothetical protein